jgi:hypothetical protein
MKRPILAGVGVVLVMAFAGNAVAQQGLYFSEDSNPNGLYSLDTTTGAATHLGSSGVTSATVGLAPTESMTELFGSSWTRLHRMRTDGSGYTDLGEAYAEALGYDSTTDTLRDAELQFLHAGHHQWRNGDHSAESHGARLRGPRL